MSETPQVDQKAASVPKPAVADVAPPPISANEASDQPGTLAATEAALKEVNEYKAATKLPTEEKTGKVVNPATKKAELSPEEAARQQAEAEMAALPAEVRPLYAKLREDLANKKISIEDAQKQLGEAVNKARAHEAELAKAKSEVKTEVEKAKEPEKEVHIESEAKDDTKSPAASESKPKTSSVNEKINRLLDKLKNNPVTNILTLPVRVVRYIFGLLQRLAQSAIDFIKK
jgi:hypothetical protein